MKTCAKCGIEKPLSEFYTDTTQYDRKRAWCRDCYYARSNAQKRRKNYLESWMEQGCQICGEHRRPALEAAHRTPRYGDTERLVSRVVKKKGLDQLIVELEDCVCLCATCHRLVDAGWLRMPDKVP